jgi:Dolichyl-phosphate-mannose-protein mannosyltransferase
MIDSQMEKTEMRPKPGAFPDPSAPPAGRFSRFALSAILLVGGLLAFGFLNNYQNWGDDWAQYILQARAILDHSMSECVRQSAFMTRESAVVPGPVAYAWGLPLLLAAEGSLFSFTLSVFKVFNVLIFLLLVVAVYRLARKFLDGNESLAAAAMFAFNPVVVHYCNHVLTELPFILSSVCAFLVMEWRGAQDRFRVKPLLLTGALAFAAFTFRTNGILILPAATIREFLPGSRNKGFRRPKIIALLLPYISFFLLNAVWGRVFPGGGEGYVALLSAVTVHTLAANALVYPVTLFDFFTGGHHSGLLAIVLWPLVLLGASKTWRKTAHLSAYALSTMALYIVWTYLQGFRFMFPVAPVLVILMMLGLDELAGWKIAGKSGLLASRAVQYGIPVFFLLVSSALVVTRRVPQEQWTPYDQPSTEMFQWIRNNTPSDAVISFFKPRAMHMLGERLCLTATPADLRKVSFFVYTKGPSWNEAQPTLEVYQRAAALTPAFENRNFVVYRVGGRP